MNQKINNNTMTASVAVYKSHEEAINAIEKLGNNNFPLKHVSLIGKAEIIDEQMHLKSLDPIKNVPLVIGSIAGPVAGLLTGLGIFAIPGFGFLYGAGAIIGTIAGFDLGMISGGLVTLLATLGIKKESVLKYEERISNGNYLVIVQGNPKEVKLAENLLHPKALGITQ